MRDEPGLFHALSDTISRATELVQLEFKVLRAELEEKAVRVKAGLAFILAGAVLVTAALFLMLVLRPQGLFGTRLRERI